MVNIWPNSFETSTDPWRAISGADTPTLSDAYAHGGSRSLYCHRGTGTSGTYARADLDLNGLPGAGSYTVDGWILVPGNVTGTNGLRVTGSGVATTTLYTEVRDAWTRLTATFDWDGVGRAVLDVYGSAQDAELWLDDLTIDDGTEPPPPPPEPVGSGIGCTVYTRPGGTGDLVRLADGSPTDDPLAPTVLTDLKITWGRDNTLDQPATSTCSFTLLDIAGGPDFLDAIALGTPIVVQAPPPAETGGSPVTVFAGRVTSMKHGWDDRADAPVVTVGTSDFTADLENTIVGDEPWSAQYLETRFATIAELTSLTEWTIDEPLRKLSLARRDIDSQGAMGLLDELALTADGVLWSSTSEDGITSSLHLEDPTLRPSPTDAGFRGVYLSACDVLRDGVEWTQDVQDVVSRVSVTWRELVVEDNESLTDRTYTIVDPDREAKFGQRVVSVSSQLRYESPAIALAERLLARLTSDAWRISGLTIDDALNDHTSNPTLTNHVLDPSGEYNGITWTGTPPVRATNGGRTGQWKYHFTLATTSAAITVQVPEGATTVTASAWYYSAGTRTVQLRLAGTGTTAVDSPAYPTTTTYQRYSLSTSVTPGGTVTFYPAYVIDRPTLYVDDLGITFNGPGTPAGTGTPEPVDFSGDTPDTYGYDYAWTDTTGASSSTRTVHGSIEEYTDTLLKTLDARARNGLAIQLVDLPAWAISGDTIVYLEGGDYTFSAGAWILELTVSGGGSSSTVTAPTWADMGNHTWAAMGTETWDDMRTVAALNQQE